MNITILTLFPGFFESPTSMGVIAGAVEQGLLTIDAVNIREYSPDKHRKCDDYSYGGGPGMVMSMPPFMAYYDAHPKKRKEHTILFTPTGTPLTQKRVKELSQMDAITLICGHYEGVDARIEHEYADEVISIGDYVVSGGEFAALTLTDAIARYSGVLGNDKSVIGDTFEEEAHGLLEYDQFTRPPVAVKRSVPTPLREGNHRHIEAWRRRNALEKTFERRPDMIANASLNANDITELFEYLKMKEHSNG